MMQLATTGWIEGLRHCPSPNFNARPAGMAVDVLVIHNISLPKGQYGTGDIDALFLNQIDATRHPTYEALKDLRVSSHLLIERSGRAVQYVSLLDRAWHAGQSSFEGRAGCNDFSIGIELEGCDDEPFTEAQYQQLVALTMLIQLHYPAITNQRITGHSTIAPERKTDPGPHFDWPFYRECLQDLQEEYRLAMRKKGRPL